MIKDLGFVVDQFSENYNVTIYKDELDDRGINIKKEVKTVTIRGSLQPHSDELEQVEYGNYNRSIWDFYVMTLFWSDLESVVKIRNKYYKITNIEDWDRYGYYVYTLVETKE